VIERGKIESLVPHAGEMCLLDRVIEWDSLSLICSSRSHLAASNPLREGGRLGAACGVEYAAQAMALHGGLTSESSAKPSVGYLLTLRDLQMTVERLDNITEDLMIKVEKLSSVETQVSYRFEIIGCGESLLRGRAMVVLAGDMP
jgi:predicted hotdog family 3-hydroxylacyl-ACP dehydratase